MQAICRFCGWKGTAYVKQGNPHIGLYCGNCGRWITWVSLSQGRILLEQQEQAKERSKN